MKKLFALLCVAALGIGSAFAQAGRLGLGGNLVYGTEVENVGIGAKFQIGITDNWRAETSFNYFFENDNFHMWELNLNAHYLFHVAPSFAVYPLSGLTYVSPVYSHGPLGDHKSDGKFGVNLGGGCEYMVTSNLGLNAEIKYSLVSDYDQAVFGVGVVYKF